MKNFTVLLSVLIACCNLQAQQRTEIEVTAGKNNRGLSPIFVSLPKALPMTGSIRLVNRKTGKSIPAQLSDSSTLVFIPEDGISAGSVNVYVLKRTEGRSANTVAVEKQQRGLLVKVKGKPFFFYHTSEAAPPVDSPDYYKRSGFIHPLYSPGGKILTDDFPAGHVHQHAIFMAWVNAVFRKTPVDFWNQQSGKGTVEHVEVLGISEGPVMATIRVRLRQKSVQYGEVLQEIWTLSIYSSGVNYFFDLQSEQQNVTTDTLFINQYHYGGLGFRGSREWNRDDKINFKDAWHILTSEGIRDTIANQTHARWVDASGKVAGAAAGVTVLGHPSNLRYPQAIRVHPTMPYWSYSPVIDGGFMIVPGVPFISRYRYLVHDGEPSAILIENMQKEYAEQPAVRVQYR